MTIKFQEEHPFEKRQAEALRIMKKYPDRVPIVIEKVDRSDIPEIDKKKYLVPKELTMSQFVYVIRKRVRIQPEKAIFLFLEDGTMPISSQMLSVAYNEHKNDDGFLYLRYGAEATFGK